MIEPNFIDLNTGKGIYIERYMTKIIDGKVRYFDRHKRLLNVKKINSEIVKASIKTPTKNRI